MTQATNLGARCRRALSPSVAVFLLIGLGLPTSCGPRTLHPVEFSQALAKARINQIAEAKALMAKVAQSEAGKAGAYKRELALLHFQIASYARVHRELDEDLAQDLKSMTRAQIESYYLETKRHEKMDRFRSEALRFRLSRLRDWMDEIERKAVQEAQPGSQGGDPAIGEVERVSDDFSEEEMSGDTTGSLMAWVAELVDDGDFASALEKLRDEMPRAGKNSDRVRKELWRVEDLGLARAKALESQAREMAAKGKMREAIVWLARQSQGYPLLGKLSLLHEVQREFEQILRTEPTLAHNRAMAKALREGRLAASKDGGVGEAIPDAPERRRSEDSKAKGDASGSTVAKPGAEEVPNQEPFTVPDGEQGKRGEQAEPGGSGEVVGLDRLREMSMADLRAARTGLMSLAKERAVEHDFATAASDYKQVALICKIQAPWLTNRYEGLAEETQLMAEAMKALQEGLKVEPRAYRSVEIGVGHKVALLSVENKVLRFQGEEGPEDLPLSKVSDADLALLLMPSVKTVRERIGAALIADRGGKRVEAEKLLRKALRSDAETKPMVDRILARMRGESAGAEGYVLKKGKFVSVAAAKRKELLTRLRKALASVWNRSTNEGRELAYKKVLASADLKPFLADGLEAEKKRLFDILSKASFKGSYKKLMKLREELDTRRAFAKELIFDAVKYFYPYRPPAVSGEKYAEYREVQKEVDARVAKVREIWDGKQVTITLPAKVQKGIDQYRWLTKKLNALGRFQSDMDAKLTLLSAKAGAMDIRNFAKDAKDRKFLDRGDEVVAANEKLFAEAMAKGEMSREQAEQIRITNAYRRMFGHRPVRCDLRLMKAAQGHSEEMSRLGYFSHTSPTAGRHSPSDRMKLAGYPGGGGENIAVNGSPSGAHAAWIHSSGHHRNLLHPRHRDMGIGVVGRYYTQNFGSATGTR